MKKYIVLVALFSLFLTGYTDLDEAVPIAMDTYGLTLSLKVPQVLSNTTSQGYRKYQNQKIKGNMNIIWMSDDSFRIEFDNLVNKTFYVSGGKVTYQGIVDREVVYTRFNWIGSNLTDSFKTPCLGFYLELEPSYSKGGNTEDNSFFLMLAGKGRSIYKKKYQCRIAKSILGYAAGTQGCGCTAYGHKSPTRVASIDGPTETPDDVVPTFGRWTAKWENRKYF